jgi:hypothetical protein
MADEDACRPCPSDDCGRNLLCDDGGRIPGPVLLENELLLERLRVEAGRLETDAEKLLRTPTRVVAFTVELIGRELGGAGWFTLMGSPARSTRVDRLAACSDAVSSREI